MALVGRCDRQFHGQFARRYAIAWLLGSLIGMNLLPGRAAAQRCTADVQCDNRGQPQAECIGDMLVVRRSTCAGFCRSIEVRRERCGPVTLGGRCIGNTFQAETRRCNAGLGACERRMERQVCVASCSCRQGVLVVATGQCSPGAGCNRVVRRCKGGCSCSPEPGCRGEGR